MSRSMLFSRSVVSSSLWPHGLQHTRFPCSSLFPGVFSNSCPLSWWCHTTISSLSQPLLLLPSIFPSIMIFSNESALGIRWPKYWTFSISISPSNDRVDFLQDWLVWSICWPRDSKQSSPAPQRESINSWVFSLAIPFSKGSSQLGDQTQIFCIAGRFFTIWATREVLKFLKSFLLADKWHSAYPNILEQY